MENKINVLTKLEISGKVLQKFNYCLTHSDNMVRKLLSGKITR